VEARESDIPDLKPPTWDDVVWRVYHPWDRDRILVDTAVSQPEDCLHMLLTKNSKDLSSAI
jgi:hypothetical protein